MTLDTRARRAAQGIHRAVAVMEMSTSREPSRLMRFERYRDHKQRNRRLGAVALAAALTIATVVIVRTGALDPGRATVPVAPDGQAEPIAPTEIGTVTLSANGCTLDALDGPLAAGVVALSAVNGTDGVAAFDVARFHPEELTYERFAAHIERERRRAEAGRPVVDGAYGPFTGLGLPEYAGVLIHEEVRRGRSATMTGTVYPGTYPIVCYRTFDGSTELRPFALAGPLELE